MRARTKACTALVAALLSACGGGGGGGTDAASGAPSSSAPLAITTTNGPAVGALMPSLGESMLALGQFVADQIDLWHLRQGGLSTVVACSNGGTLTSTLTDRDSDGVASAGDRLTIQGSGCAVPVLTDVLTGTLTVDLTAAPDLPSGGYRAMVATGTGLVFGTVPAGPSAVGFSGSFLLDRFVDELHSNIRLRSTPTDDVHLSIPSGSTSASEAFRQFDLSKNIDYTTARSTIAFSFRYDSSLLGGSVTVTTPQPFLAYVNADPDVGQMQATGTGTVTITPDAVTTSAFKVAVDANGDGTPEVAGALNWSDYTSAYLWWDGASAFNFFGAQQLISVHGPSDPLSATFHEIWRMSTDTTLRLQFSRPVASTTPVLYARLVDEGDGSLAARVDIPATVEPHGAALLLRLSGPLQHAHQYDVTLSLDNVNWFGVISIQDTTGSSVTLSGAVGTFQTPATMSAVAVADGLVLLAPTDVIRLDGGTSSSTTRPIASYFWTQLSGSPLTFSAPAQATTTLSWAGGANDPRTDAVVQLTVTDAGGDTERAQLTVRSRNAAASSHLLYFRSAPGDYIGAGKTMLFSEADLDFRESLTSASSYSGQYVRNFLPVSYEFWNLYLAGGDGLPFHVGAYENATRFVQGTGNGIDFFGDGRGCNATVGRFDVLEIASDPGGNITKFAVDFEQHCEMADAPALLGSYRFNSTLPIRR